jgi:pimeloyl-ACP methyl ester carboxylesterase
MEPRVLQHEVKGHGDPIVLVPGGLTGWLSWIPHAERLSADRRTIRVQPIHNELGSRGEMVDPSYDDDVERECLRLTLDELGIGVADFAGWSGGARAMIEFSLTYPKRIRTLTLIEPPAFWAAHQSGLERDAETQRMEAFVDRIGGRPISEDELEEFLLMAGFAHEGVDLRTLPQWERWLPHKDALAGQYLLGRKERKLAEIEAFDRPVLLVKGTVSSEWLRGIVDILGEHYPESTVLELPGSHACHIEDIGAFLQALQAHLASVNVR